MKVLHDVLAVDRRVHEPVRLCVLAILASVDSADFVYVQKTLAVTGGNLSTHLTKLTEAGLVEMEKAFADSRPRSTLRITEDGRSALQAYRAAMGGLLERL